MIEGTSAMDRPLASKRLSPRRLALLAALVLLPLTVGAFFYPSFSRWMRAERSVQISRLRIGEVVRGNLERDLSVQGRIVAAFHPTVFSPTSGIVSLQVRAGEVVTEGQGLAQIESPELRNRLEQERSRLLSLETELERQQILVKQTLLANQQGIDLASVRLEAAERAMLRAQRSRDEGILNDVEYEKAQDDLRMAELELEHARQDAALERETLEFELRSRELEADQQRLVVAEMQRQVDELWVRSPVAGLVSRVQVEDHDAVTTGQPLITVVDLSAFEIEIQTPEAYSDEIAPGTPAVVRYDGEDYAAQVRSISPEVEGSQVKGVVVFTADAPQGLKQNQRVSTRLVLESKTDVLKVQRGPFLEVGGGRQAFLLDGSTAVLQPIETGAASITEVEILSGLAEGDRIIISDTTRFQDAKRLYLRQ
jgi:HlyD family secretion protein